MRNQSRRLHSIFHALGHLLVIFSVIQLVPLLVVVLYWGQRGDGWETVAAFVVPAALSMGLGLGLLRWCRREPMSTTAGMLLCAVAWLATSAIGAVPFVIGIGSAYLDGFFEAMSGFTTTGITVFMGLDDMPHSILFWRSLTQWVGGIGILSFFLAIVSRGGGSAGAHHIYGAESHKISSTRPTPGLFNTLKILWGIYSLFTVCCALLLWVEGQSLFDAICHAFTALSTGGYSPHDASIAWYAQQGVSNYRAMEYTLTLFMMFGGMNFLVHYRVLTGDIRALWKSTEIRLWWKLIGLFTVIIMAEHLLRGTDAPWSFPLVEETFRKTVFQVIALLTTTGFGTQDINSPWFGAVARQLFLVMMVIGGCVGSTGGGIKVLRIAVLKKLMGRELFKLRNSTSAVSDLVIDHQRVPDDETRRIAALFFTWMALLLLGGAVTAALTDLDGWSSFSGMFSALGNIGPSYISVPEMVTIHWGVKITYIFGMLAGRLEILPVLLLFSRRAWR
ncbi:MAG: TrkH family potassium uptake protein [Planctomycetota bacterium]